MALVSAGVQVTIIDESQYTSAASATVPYILIATAENKLDPSGDAIAQGTLQSESDNLFLVTSQRELVNTFGEPTFYKTSAGNALHGYELNEYGLMAAYSVLGATNRAYIQRVDIDLAEIEGALTRPIGKANNGEYWNDLSETDSGLFVWNSVTNKFDLINPIFITDPLDAPGFVPLNSIGQIGSYAIVATNGNYPIYNKLSDNTWELVGSDLWKIDIPTVVGTESNPVLTTGNTFTINTAVVAVTGTTLTTLKSDIDGVAIPGLVTAIVNNRLELYIDSNTTPASNTLTIVAGGGTILTDIGITAGTYYGPIVQHSSHVDIPRWRVSDTEPHPAGSIWHKTTSVNAGANIVLKRYNAQTDVWVQQPNPLYANDQTANKFLDPATGGESISTGDTYVQYDVNENDTGTYKIFTRTFGKTSVTGVAFSATTAGDSYTIEVSQKNQTALTALVTVTLNGTTAVDFVTDTSLALAGIAEVEVTQVNGIINFTHVNGGVIVLNDVNNTPIAFAGISDALDNVRLNGAGDLVLSNWNALDQIASQIEPGQDPLNATRWYYSDISEVDIMIHDNGEWVGYHNVLNDVRGFDLSFTDPNGPIISVLAPDTQSDDTQLEVGDLWIDTSNIEEYPIIRRWGPDINNVNVWNLIDNADQTSVDGILFADARWGDSSSAFIDPITDPLPIIAANISTDLLHVDYTDPDAPNKNLYPDGMLLWNTRRSGYNVKEFRLNYFNASDFDLSGHPFLEANAWVSVSGNREDGSPNFGRHAQRSMVLKAMKAAIDSNPDIREEQRLYNLIAVPGYPELIPNMVALNNERDNTAFVVGDTPMRLANNGNDIAAWASNGDGLGIPSNDGLASNDEYLGVFYPSGRTNDLSGTSIVVPPSHMMLRTIIHSDDQSYPWMAPAGTRRGVIDNANSIGYIDSVTGEFQQKQVREGIRDVLYVNNVNPITFIPGAGIVNWGNKTTKPGSAQDRINVSRLISHIRLQLDAIGKQFVFEPNDKITRDELKGQIDRMLNDLVAKRGLYDFIVVSDRSNNTPVRIDRNELWVDIAIEPVKAAEFILIPLRIKNTGEISGGQ